MSSYTMAGGAVCRGLSVCHTIFFDREGETKARVLVMHRADSDEPLLGGAPARPSTSAAAWYAFLEGQTPAGARYEALTVFLIFVNVVAFVVGTLFVVEYKILNMQGSALRPVTSYSLETMVTMPWAVRPSSKSSL